MEMSSINDRKFLRYLWDINRRSRENNKFSYPVWLVQLLFEVCSMADVIYHPTDSIRISCFKSYIFLKSSINELDISTKEVFQFVFYL